MKLRNFEIEAIVDSVYNKLEEKERLKFKKPEIIKVVNEINKELGEELDKINKLIKNFKKIRDKKYEEFKLICGEDSGYNFNMNGMGEYRVDKNEFIVEPNYSLVSWSVKEKIRNKVILSNIKGEEIDKLIDDLVREFSN